MCVTQWEVSDLDELTQWEGSWRYRNKPTLSELDLSPASEELLLSELDESDEEELSDDEEDVARASPVPFCWMWCPSFGWVGFSFSFLVCGPTAGLVEELLVAGPFGELLVAGPFAELLVCGGTSLGIPKYRNAAYTPSAALP